MIGINHPPHKTLPPVMNLGLSLYQQIILIAASLYALVVIFLSILDKIPSESNWVIAAYICLTVVNVVILWKRRQQRQTSDK